MPDEPAPAAVHPAIAETARGMLDRQPELAQQMALAIREHEEIYRDGGVVPYDDLLKSCEDHISYVLGELAGLDRDTRTASRMGRRRAEQGVPLPALLHAYRLGARLLGNAMLEQAARLLKTEILLIGVRAAWEILEDYSEAVAASYLEARGERAQRDAQARNALVGALIAGELAEGPQLLEAAMTLQLPMQGRFVAVAMDASAHGVEERLRVRGVRSAWHTGVDSYVGVILVPGDGSVDTVCRLLGKSARAGVSAGYAGLEHSAGAAREARLALIGARRREVVRYDEAPLPILLASAPEAAGHLATQVLGPIVDLGEKERDILLDTLDTWFSTGGSAAKTAAAMYVHRNTIGYRIQQIETLTGRKLTDARHAAELYLAMESRRILET